MFNLVLKTAGNDYMGKGTFINPVVSSIPSMIFMFCIACPDAPFNKLSIAEVIKSCALNQIINCRNENETTIGFVIPETDITIISPLDV